MQATGGDASWLNGKNKRHNRIINNIVKEGLLDNNQHLYTWCCEVDISKEVHTWKLHSELDNTSPHFAWYGEKPRIHVLKNLDVIYTP